jgi:hypothetical protein
MHTGSIEMGHLHNLKLTTDPSVAPDVQIIWEKSFQNILFFLENMCTIHSYGWDTGHVRIQQKGPERGPTKMQKGPRNKEKYIEAPEGPCIRTAVCRPSPAPPPRSPEKRAETNSPSSVRLHCCAQLSEPRRWVVKDDTFVVGARRSGPCPKHCIELRIQNSPSTMSRKRTRSAGLEPSKPEQVSPSSGPPPATPA